MSPRDIDTEEDLPDEESSLPDLYPLLPLRLVSENQRGVIAK